MRSQAQKASTAEGTQQKKQPCNTQTRPSIPRLKNSRLQKSKLPTGTELCSPMQTRL